MLPSTSDSKASRAPSQPSLSETDPSLMDTHCQTSGCELWQHTKEADFFVHIRVYYASALIVYYARAITLTHDWWLIETLKQKKI